MPTTSPRPRPRGGFCSEGGGGDFVFPTPLPAGGLLKEAYA